MANLHHPSADDQWLTSLFQTATGPFVDSAFAERLLSRLRRRERLRLLVILGAGLMAVLIAMWLANGLSAVVPVFDFSQIRLPTWLTTSSIGTVGVLLAALAVWVVAEEA